MKAKVYAKAKYKIKYKPFDNSAPIDNTVRQWERSYHELFLKERFILVSIKY